MVIYGPGGVAVTIQFNRKPFPSRGEVEDVGIDRHLPGELPAFEPMTAQNVPNRTFRWSQFATQYSCSLESRGITCAAH